MNLGNITLQVINIARNTGSYLASERKNFKKENVIEKNSHDYVSYVDREAEKRTVKELKKLLPKAGFITEEATVEQSGKGLNWVIDPLDGTTNYIQDYAPFCVSIALCKDDEILIGVVYEVTRDECFYAWKDSDAYMNGTPIQVSNKKLENAFIGLDLPYNAEHYKPILLNIFTNLYGKVSSIRIGGSAATSLCYVAAGRYDGWAEAFISRWDYSAGVLIIRRAGGMITDFNGNKDITHHIVASNGVIHEELQEAVLNNFTSYITISLDTTHAKELLHQKENILSFFKEDEKKIQLTVCDTENEETIITDANQSVINEDTVNPPTEMEMEEEIITDKIMVIIDNAKIFAEDDKDDKAYTAHIDYKNYLFNYIRELYNTAISKNKQIRKPSYKTISKVALLIEYITLSNGINREDIFKIPGFDSKSLIDRLIQALTLGETITVTDQKTKRYEITGPIKEVIEKHYKQI